MSDTLYMLIDTTTLAEARIATVAPLHEATAIGRIMKANGREVCAPPMEGRGFSKLTLEQLQYIYWNHTQTPPTGEYAELVQQCLALANTLPVDERELADLEAEVAALYPDGLATFAPDSTAEGATPAKTARAPRAKREAGPPRQVGEAPKATSTTGKVWVIADEVFTPLAKKFAGAVTDKNAAGWKPIRDAVVAACVASGINEATAATQYSKWKASKMTAASA